MRNAIISSECLLIQTINKPLPFRSTGWQRWDKNVPETALYVTDQWQAIIIAIKNAYLYGKKIVIIDDFQYVMANEFMRRSHEKSFDKFTEIGHHAWSIIDNAIRETPTDLRIYFLSHTEETALGKTKIKTIGKMLDEKITLEGLFTLVLRTVVQDGTYWFTTQNSGADTVKSPINMFDSHEIDNDLAKVDATTRTKTGYSANRQKYLAELICQRLTGQREDLFITADMRRGTELEAVASQVYVFNEFTSNVTEVGLIDHLRIKGFAASPDGLVNDDGLVEIKCPKTWTHLETVRTGKPKQQYLLQMHAQMLCTGCKWCDFVSYDDRLPVSLAYFKTRIPFDKALGKEMETEVRLFLAELEENMAKIKAYGRVA